MKDYLSLIKFSHTIFALPFAILGYTLATIESGAHPDWRIFILVLLCMIFARSAAMAFNRLLDRDIDELNPRTKVREIPAGVISSKNALFFVIFNVIAFIVTTFFINNICFYLAPVALIIILGYSYTKRFTALCHLVLGLGLSLAPIGAYLAVIGHFDVLPVLYSIAVLFWVAGFDIIYALQDEAFDKSLSLHSIPVSLGTNGALKLSSFFHVICAGVIIYAAYLLQQKYLYLGWINWIAVLLFIGLLMHQHRLVKPNDLSKVDLAFFTTNGLASICFCGLIVIDIFF